MTERSRKSNQQHAAITAGLLNLAIDKANKQLTEEPELIKPKEVDEELWNGASTHSQGGHNPADFSSVPDNRMTTGRIGHLPESN